ncbi:MAG: LysR family transcriptional regulator [Planctomycetota bacterium]
MEWLNYHHLYYFWTVAKQGSVSGAARVLHLARPTVTSQVRELENACGQKLLRQQGRGIVLTDYGQSVFSYADDIFSIGRELKHFIEVGKSGVQKRLRVGVHSVVPKHIVVEFLKPALEFLPKVKIECRQGELDVLLADLSIHRLEVVITDQLVPSSQEKELHSHQVAQGDVSFWATSELASHFRSEFPKSLAKASMLMPASSTALRRAIDRWASSNSVELNAVVESDDWSMLEALARAGAGVLPIVDANRSSAPCGDLQLVGHLSGAHERYFAVCSEQRVRPEVVDAVLQQAES